MADERRIVAHFRPQVWINDYAVDIDGAYDFDVTETVLAMPREQALAIEDHSYEADAVWRDHPVSEERPHHGPFEVGVAESIRAYFEEEDDG
jgi:hypothetical protein